MSSMNHELIFRSWPVTLLTRLGITWPDLREQVLTSVGVDQTITLHNSDAQVAKPKSDPVYQPIFCSAGNKKLIEFKHVENNYVDFRKQILLPHFLSTQGPR